MFGGFVPLGLGLGCRTLGLLLVVGIIGLLISMAW